MRNGNPNRQRIRRLLRLNVAISAEEHALVLRALRPKQSVSEFIRTAAVRDAEARLTREAGTDIAA